MPMLPVASIQSLLLEVALIALKLPVNWSLPEAVFINLAGTAEGEALQLDGITQLE